MLSEEFLQRKLGISPLLQLTDCGPSKGDDTLHIVAVHQLNGIFGLLLAFGFAAKAGTDTREKDFGDALQDLHLIRQVQHELEDVDPEANDFDVAPGAPMSEREASAVEG